MHSMIAHLAVAFATHTSPLPESAPADCRHLPSPPTTAATPNDNRVPAGTLTNGVLSVSLVAQSVAWRPDGPSGCALTVNAFAEAGRPVQIPGPMIRVTSGTEVRVTVRNTLSTRLVLRGFHDRTKGSLDSVEVPAGETRVVRFVPTIPGAWYYSAARGALAPVSDVDGQLVGALIVDPPNDERPATTRDRVMVFTRWNRSATPSNQEFQLNALNGRSWPNTERLSFTEGDSVYWKLINASNTTHEMHLHGFYFLLKSSGYVIDSGKAGGAPPLMRVTSVLRPGEWITVAWSPDRAGNWLFHCHILTHMSAAQRLDRMNGTAQAATTTHAGHASTNHALDEMAGLVMGMEVKPRAGTVRESPNEPGRRRLALFANERPNRFGDRSGFGFILQEGGARPARDSIRIPGTPLLLKRGEPVAITVHNRLRFPISVHWHGIELESYFDGVGGFSGAGPRIAPMIAPGDSFVVHMTPPRAGTYIYHVHGEAGEELASGLYGALLVLDPSVPYEPGKERLFVMGDDGPGLTKPIAINGSSTPDPMEMVVGTSYRLRFIFISADDVFMHTLRGPAGVVDAQVIAQDGHDVDATFLNVVRPMRFPTGPGHTRDYVFTPTVAGDYTLAAQRIVSGTVSGMTAGPITTLRIRVR